MSSFKTFVLIWLGQFTSVIGSKISGFALGFWILKETGSITQFALVLLAVTLPAVIVSPFAGVIVDRYSRKWIMIISDSVAGVTTLFLLTMLLFNQLEIWHVYLATSISSIFSSFQIPAYQSSVSVLVPKKQLGRANGMIQLSDSASLVIAPIIAGFLLHKVGLQMVMILDFITFVIALGTLVAARIPMPERTQVKKQTPNFSEFLAEAKEGWLYILERPAFKVLLISSLITNFLLGFVNTLFQPYILSVSNEQTLGLVISSMGIAMLLGGITMSTWGGPKSRIKGMLGFSGVCGLFLALSGFTSSISIITVSIFIALFVLPISNACGQSIWQDKIALAYQGRVFALKRMIKMSLMPLAIVSAGPLVDKVFNPMMEQDGFLANSMGSVIGVGEGRGIALLILLSGVLWVCNNIVVYSQPRVRGLEEEEIPETKVEAKATSAI